MNVYRYGKQIRAIIAIELVLVAVFLGIAYAFWTHMCDETLESCVASGPIAGPTTFLLLAAIRPFVFTPFLFVAVIGGKVFGTGLGTFLTVIGGLVSGLAVFGIGKSVGRRLTKPWLRSNLPATFKFLRSQDYKIVFALRLLPIIPFDLASFLFGALDFRLRSVAIATLIGTIPEAYLYAKLVDPNETLLSGTVTTLVVFGTCIILPLLAFEFFSRKKGTGMWQLLKAMYGEITFEVQSNNDIVRRQTFQADKTPVLLLYGFFSSRRTVTILERMLTARGHQVLSFNLGGVLGTFFTRDILETAAFIDYKIKRQIDRHGFKKIHIVAHSKGGLVALWWLLNLEGHKICDKVITMGTPFKGSPLTYLALITPLGLFWRDVWQMRPGSAFLQDLRGCQVPQSVGIYCLHSHRDRVAPGTSGVFKPKQASPQVHAIAMDHVGHFEFLYRRDVGDSIAKILQDETGGACVPAAVPVASGT